MTIGDSLMQIVSMGRKVNWWHGDRERTSQFLCSPIVLGVSWLASLTGCYAIAQTAVKAQVTSDGTLETVTNTADNVTEITGGSIAGSNLFHSFSSFSLGTNQTAAFNNGLEIGNIISRVTGGNISNIDGTIAANGNANLILINPSGINFGANASLDIGGSFLGTTAESITFADGTVFSATDTQNAPLLTISVPVGLQMGASAAIQVTDTGYLGSDLTVNPGLAVPPGETLALVGNGIVFNGGIITAESGRIELGSLSSGEVNIGETDGGWQLSYGSDRPSDIELLAESSLGNPNLIDNADGGIYLWGKNISLERSQIVGQTLAESWGSNIKIDASQSLSIRGAIEDGTIPGSQILNEVRPNANGNGGAIEITTPQLEINDGGSIFSITKGNGVSGDITVTAQDIFLKNTSSTFPGFGGGIISYTTAGADTGNIEISTQNLSLLDGAEIYTSVLVDTPNTRAAIPNSGTGNAGDIIVNATESIEVIGASTVAPDIPSDLGSFTFGAGNAGDVTVSTKELTIGNGGFVESGVLNSSSSFGAPAANSGTGNGGNVLVNASESIEVYGVNPSNFEPSALNTFTYGGGNAGEATVNTARLIVRDGGQVTSQTAASGNAGKLTVNAPQIEVRGIDPNTGVSSEIGANAFLFNQQVRADFFLPDIPTGNSGELNIDTENLTVSDRGRIAIQNDGTGDAGRLTINTKSLLLENGGAIEGATILGTGGTIAIDTNTLRLDRGLINASTLGEGTGGNIEIKARDYVEVIGSGFVALQEKFFNPRFFSAEFLANLDVTFVTEGILAATTGDGAAGTIAIETPNLRLLEGGLIGTASVGNGAAGAIALDSEFLQVDASIITASTIFAGRGGDVEIDTRELEVLTGGQLIASTLGSGDGGNLTIDATESITVSGISPDNSLLSNIAVGAQPLATATGNGGDLTITTSQLEIDDRGEVSVGSLGTGDAGTLRVDADFISLDNGGTISAATQSGSGGNIILNADNIVWLGNSTTTATAAGAGNGGNISIDSENVVALESSRLTANANLGRGGNIQIDSQGLFVCEECQVTASSQLGLDGVVEIETLEPNNDLQVVNLPQQLTQPQETVFLACNAERSSNNSELTIIGRGGLPPRPQEPLSGDSSIDIATPAAKQSDRLNKNASKLPLPAQNWYVNSHGTVVLTARSSEISDNSTLPNPDCHVR
jgi:filamentous hemagglutinin family protein